jgi:hypothetical protein
MSTSASATEARPTRQRVLIAIDGSTASERALAYAERIVHANAFVHLVSIADNPRTLVPLGSHATSFLHAARNELLKDAADCLSRAERTMTRRADIVVNTEVVDLSSRCHRSVAKRLKQFGRYRRQAHRLGFRFARHKRSLRACYALNAKFLTGPRSRHLAIGHDVRPTDDTTGNGMPA